jgi:high-affinity Fe2+/Pb2+ permease
MLFAPGHSLAIEPMLLLSTVYTWLPEKLDLLDGMILGAGFGSALGGGFGLLLKWKRKTIELENFVATGTIIGVVAGGLFVAAGHLNIF